MIVPLILGSAALGAASSGGAAAHPCGERVFSLPVMAVAGDGEDACGDFRRVRLEWKRSGSSDPLRVALSDDEPGGSGQAFSTAAWNAAVAAGLMRGDLLNGVRVVFDIKGGYDGPSAGSAMCLAFLAALDGREFPADFGITGTVSPDGSIGPVGGVEKKIRAAAAAGLKRFAIPHGMVFEDKGDENAIPPAFADLRRLGGELGVEVRTVRTAEEAYHYAFGESAPTSSGVGVDEQIVLALPPEFERACVSGFLDAESGRREFTAREKKKDRGRAKKERGSVGCPCPEELLAEWGRDDIASVCYREGSPYAAAREAEFGAAAREMLPQVEKLESALVKEFPALAGIGDDSVGGNSRGKMRDAILALRERGNGLVKHALDEARCGMYAGFAGTSPAAMQLVGDARIGASAVADYARMAADGPGADGIRAVSDTSEEAGGIELLRNAYRVELMGMALDSLCALRLRRQRGFLEPLACALPAVKVVGDPKVAAHFLYSAWRAVYDDFLTGYVAEEADERGVSAEAVKADLFFEDERYAYAEAFMARAAYDLTRLENGCTQDHALACAFVQAEALATAVALRVKYVPYDSAYLRWASARARTMALASMDSCRRAGIPYPAAVAAFRRAEGAFGGKDADFVCNVLGEYLSAHWQAKLLAMMFAPAQ